MDLLQDLNPEQRQAVLHDQGPVLVVAGAGTGKTAVITRRVAHLIATGKARPDQILALTFTDKAAREMEERVDVLVPYGMVTTRIMTFHAFGDSLLKTYAIDIGLSLNYTVMTAAQQIVWLREHIDDLKLDYYAPVSSPDSYLAALSSYFGRLKDELVSPAQYLSYARRLSREATDAASRLEAQKQLELAQAYQTYIKLTRREGVIDFGDQIMLASQLLKQRPNILAEVRAGIRYILVDEFQDTNPAQNYLLNQLAGKRGNLMVVGDDDQSIYKFRGAAISNILAFGKHYPRSKQIVLVQNYRSTQEVLDTSYRLIQYNNPDRLEFRNQIDKRLRAETHGPQPEVRAEANYQLEAVAIAQAIAEQLDRGEKPEEIAVLVRKNNQAKPILEALAARRISYSFSGQSNLFDEVEVRILLYFLQQLADPANSSSLYHLLESEVFGADIYELASEAALARRRNQTLEETLRARSAEADEFGEFLARFMVQLDEWRRLSKDYTVGQLAFEFLNTTGYLEKLVRDSKANPGLEARVQSLGRFFSTLKDYESVAKDKSVMAYVRNLAAIQAAGGEGVAEVDRSERRVQVLTVHKAKGLEFGTVYLFDMTRGTFPATRRAETIKLPDALLDQETLPEGDWQIQEERRLAYVAMTRAKTNLIMTYSPDHGGKMQKRPSPFLREAIGRELPEVGPSSLANAQRQIELFRYDPGGVPDLLRRFYRDDKLVLTPHQIDDYLTCPQNFYYLYVLAVPQPSNINLVYGSLIHSVISQYFSWRRRRKVELEQLAEMVNRLWRREDFLSRGSEERRLAQAHQVVRRFYEREEGRQCWPDEVERDFQFELDGAEVIIKGRFDAVYVQPEVEIRDYKTSVVEDETKANKKAADNLQLGIYALAWRKLTGKVPARVVLDFVETGILGVAHKAETDLEKTEAKIKTAARGIRQNDFEPGSNCFYCSHPEVLDARR